MPAFLPIGRGGESKPTLLIISTFPGSPALRARSFNEWILRLWTSTCSFGAKVSESNGFIPSQE
jgi:hypothetical protein